MNLEELKELETDIAAAYREALVSQELNSGGESGSIRRPDIDKLWRHLQDVRRQIKLLEGSGGPAVNVGIPRRDY